MKEYTFKIIARLVGSIGCMYPIIVTVSANNKEAARLKLYDTYEHIRIVSVNVAS